MSHAAAVPRQEEVVPTAIAHAEPGVMQPPNQAANLVHAQYPRVHLDEDVLGVLPDGLDAVVDEVALAPSMSQIKATRSSAPPSTISRKVVARTQTRRPKLVLP